jgi:hypothetical protein
MYCGRLSRELLLPAGRTHLSDLEKEVNFLGDFLCLFFLTGKKGVFSCLRFWVLLLACIFLYPLVQKKIFLICVH